MVTGILGLANDGKGFDDMGKEDGQRTILTENRFLSRVNKHLYIRQVFSGHYLLTSNTPLRRYPDLMLLTNHEDPKTPKPNQTSLHH